MSRVPAASERIYIAHGYGIKVYVDRGHLTVHHGVGRDRHTRRFNRATASLKRLVVIGHTGYVTLDALRWIRDVGASFIQIDSDGNIIAATAAARDHEAK